MDSPAPDTPVLTMYTTRWCGDCTITKNYLTKFNVPFDEVDIESDPSAAEYVMGLNAGRRSVPTLVIDGKATSLSGFTRDKFNAFMREHDLLP